MTRRLDQRHRLRGALCHRRSHTARGFSLIEVMIAVGIFAMIAGLLFSALWSGQAQVARMSRAIGEDEQLLTARRVLKSWIEAATVAGLATAQPRSQDPPQQAAAPLFRGEQSLFVFNATPAERDGSSGLYRIEVAIERGTETAARSRLVIRRQRINVLSGSTAGPVETGELLSTARPLGFLYGDELGTGQGGTGQLWSEIWEDSGRLPTRIQINDGQGPLLMVSLPIGKDPRCVLARGIEMLAGGECFVR